MCVCVCVPQKTLAGSPGSSQCCPEDLEQSSTLTGKQQAALAKSPR